MRLPNYALCVAENITRDKPLRGDSVELGQTHNHKRLLHAFDRFGKVPAALRFSALTLPECEHKRRDHAQADSHSRAERR